MQLCLPDVTVCLVWLSSLFITTMYFRVAYFVPLFVYVYSQSGISGISVSAFSTTLSQVTSVADSFQDNPARTGQKICHWIKNPFYQNQNGSKCDQLFPAISVKICKMSSCSMHSTRKGKGNNFGPFWDTHFFTRPLLSYAAEFQACSHTARYIIFFYAYSFAPLAEYYGFIYGRVFEYVLPDLSLTRN